MQPRLLAKRASDLSRRIYASLPWGYRLAALFEKLASGIVDAFSRVVYAEFIKRGVTGLPDIGDVPALAWQEKLQALGTRAGDKLPRGYGRKFGQSAWNILLSKFKDPGLVEDVMTSITVKLIKNPTMIHPGISEEDGQKFVRTILMNQARDELRRQGRKREVGLGQEDEEGEFSGDTLDPEAMYRLEEAIPPQKLPELLRALDRVHPSAGAYIKLLLEGYNKAEIARGAMLPHMKGPAAPQAITNWEKLWLPKIQKVLRTYMDSLEPV